MRRDRHNEALKKEVEELNAILGERPLINAGVDHTRDVQRDTASRSKMSDDDVVALMMLAARSGASDTGAARTPAFNKSTQLDTCTNTETGAEDALETNKLHPFHDIGDSDDAIDDIGIDMGMDIAHWDKEMENVLARMDGLNATPASKTENVKEKDSHTSSSVTAYKNTTSSSSSLSPS